MSADDHWDLDGDDAAPAHGAFSTVPGVYNYCDAWCERCVFQLRCAVFRDRVLMHAEMELRQDNPEVVHAKSADRVNSTTSSSGDLTLAPAALDEADVNVETEMAAWETRRQQREADPLYLQARQYADLTRASMQSLLPEIESTGDPILMAGLDVIQWHMYAIPVKVRRALGGLFDPLLDDDDEDDPVQTDYNGTAKLVRLMIAESRIAWELLLQSVGRTHPGRLSGMLDRLAILDAGMAARFPRAMEFVRPGFDE